jgi:hypothetical protein
MLLCESLWIWYGFVGFGMDLKRFEDFGYQDPYRMERPKVSHILIFYSFEPVRIGAIPKLISRTKSHHKITNFVILCPPRVSFLSTSQKRPRGLFCDDHKGQKSEFEFVEHDE